MDGSLNQPICCMPDKQTFLSVAACCYVSTDVLHQPPSVCWVLLWSLSCWGINLSVSGCTDADLSLLKARHKLRVTSLLLPAPISQAYDFLCRAQSPIVKPQVTPDPSGLPPQNWGETLTHTFSWVVCSVTHPPDTLLDRDTCMLPLIEPFVFFCGRQAFCMSLAHAVLRLRAPSS